MTPGAVLSMMYVSSVPGSPAGNPLPAKSLMFWEARKLSPTSPLNVAKFPPETVTSYVRSLMDVTLATAAVLVPLTAKSVALTPVTSSSNVARKTSVSAFVGLVVGACRTKEISEGAVRSLVMENCVATLLLFPARSWATLAATLKVIVPLAVGVMSTVNTPLPAD